MDNIQPPTPDEIIACMQQLYPDQFRVCVLTVTNKRQAELIQRFSQNSEFWNNGNAGNGE